LDSGIAVRTLAVELICRREVEANDMGLIGRRGIAVYVVPRPIECGHDFY
jgi:hypothetical protein